MKIFRILTLFAFLSLFVMAGCEEYDIGAKLQPDDEKDSDNDAQLTPEELALQKKAEERRLKYNSLLSRDSVMAVVNRFLDAVNRADQQTFLSCINLDEMHKYYVDQKKSFTIDDFLKYLDVEEARKVFAFYDWKMDPDWKEVYYARKMRGDPDVGWACYNLTPKKKYVELYDCKKTFVHMRLKINIEDPKWEIVNMNFPREYNLLRGVTVTIKGKTNWEVWRYRVPLEEYVKFKRNHKSDENYYVPPDQYKIKWLKTLQPIDEDRPEVVVEYDPFKDVVIPELISNADIETMTDKQEALYGRIRSAKVGAWRDAEPADAFKQRAFVGALINLIIESAVDHFKNMEKRNIAIEANKALQKIYSKDTGSDRYVYGLSIGEMSTIEDKADSVGIIHKWIELFDQAGWER